MTPRHVESPVPPASYGDLRDDGIIRDGAYGKRPRERRAASQRDG